MPENLVPLLLKEWQANALRWEVVARQARRQGIGAWNPAIYAFATFRQFLEKFPPKSGALLVLGLNPGPHGMSQTGIPFTDCRTARETLGIPAQLPGHAPADLIKLLRKASGKWRSTYERSSLGIYRFLRLGWGGDLRRAYQNVFVANTCPLLFLERDGKNLTPAHAAIRSLKGMQELRRQATERFYHLLKPRGILCLGNDVKAILGETAGSLVGHEQVITYPHPARADPTKWAQELIEEIRRVGLDGGVPQRRDA